MPAGDWAVTARLSGAAGAVVSLLAFTVSLDDYLITSFVSPWETLPVYIYSRVKRGVTPEINAVSTLLLLATFVLIVLVQRLTRPPALARQGDSSS